MMGHESVVTKNIPRGRNLGYASLSTNPIVLLILFHASTSFETNVGERKLPKHSTHTHSHTQLSSCSTSQQERNNPINPLYLAHPICLLGSRPIYLSLVIITITQYVVTSLSQFCQAITRR